MTNVEDLYRKPTDDAITRQFGTAWNRFLGAIPLLNSRVSTIENILPGIGPGPPLARILAQGTLSLPSLGGNSWVPLPITDLVPSPAPVNIALSNGAIQYQAAEPNNLQLSASAFLDNVSIGAIVEFGFRRNGEDSTVVPQQVAQSRSEFAATYFGICDVVQNDLIEFVARFSTAQVNVVYRSTLYAQHTGFAPNGG